MDTEDPVNRAMVQKNTKNIQYYFGWPLTGVDCYFNISKICYNIWVFKS